MEVPRVFRDGVLLPTSWDRFLRDLAKAVSTCIAAGELPSAASMRKAGVKPPKLTDDVESAKAAAKKMAEQFMCSELLRESVRIWKESGSTEAEMHKRIRVIFAEKPKPPPMRLV